MIIGATENAFAVVIRRAVLSTTDPNFMAVCIVSIVRKVVNKTCELRMYCRTLIMLKVKKRKRTTAVQIAVGGG